MVVKSGIAAVTVLAMMGCNGERADLSGDAVTVKLSPAILAKVVSSAYVVPGGDFTVCDISQHGDHDGTTALHFGIGDKISIAHDRPEQSKLGFAGSLTQELDAVNVKHGTDLVALVGSAMVKHVDIASGQEVEVEHMFRVTRELATSNIGHCDYRKKVISIDVCWRKTQADPFACRKPGTDYGHVHADQ